MTYSLKRLCTVYGTDDLEGVRAYQQSTCVYVYGDSSISTNLSSIDNCNAYTPNFDSSKIYCLQLTTKYETLMRFSLQSLRH